MTASNYFVPSQLVISNIVSAVGSSPLTIVITVQVGNYRPGDRVRFFIPKQRGMQQLNGVIGEVFVALVAPFGNAVIFLIDSSSFDRFIPGPVNPKQDKFLAQLIPVGEDALTLVQATHNNNNIIPEIYGAKPSPL